MRLREAKVHDIAALAKLHGEAFDIAWGPKVLEEFVGTDIVLVAGDPIHGFIIVRQVLNEAEIITLAVASTARHDGIGTMLLTAGCAKAAELGVIRIILEVGVDNFAARGLYQKAGFREVGTRKGYYTHQDGTQIDALIMSHTLNCN